MVEARKSHPWWNVVRFGFRLLYNEFAFTYDLVSKTVSLGAWRCWQRTALKHLNAAAGARILEIAHGTGDLQLDLNAAGFRVYGHDLSRNMGRITQAKLKRHSLPTRLSRGKAQELPYPSGAFAAVVSTFPAEFILAPETLREVHRVLQPEGHFVIVPNGVLVGSSAVVAGIEWLYRATGQRGEGTPSEDLTIFFDAYGFKAEILEEPCPRSVATVILARKKP
jgi:ubiquinone/menaquinone biosynthesis C-methylase UbiE